MSEIRQSTAGGGGGEEGNQLSRGHCAGPSRVSASGVLDVCAQQPHTREREREGAAERRVPDCESDRACAKWVFAGRGLFMMARRD